jgi:hypothetical protein
MKRGFRPRITAMSSLLAMLVTWSETTLTLFAADAATEAATAIRVDATRVTHIMHAGLGASWHAMGQTPFWYRDLIGRDNRTCRGSGFGGYPPLDFAEAWNDILAHARWLGLDFCRVEIDMRMYEPERGRFDWDGAEMQALYRILDHCQANQVDVLLAQMWQDVEWNAHEGVCRLQSSPKSVEDFATGLGTLLDHLVKTRKYTCIRWMTVGNEPGFDGCWWLGPDKKPASLMPAIRAVRAELNRRGLRDLAVAGPDVFRLDMAGFDADDKTVGALALHCYGGDVPLGLFREAAAKARARGIPCFVSEFGHFFMAPCEGVNFAMGGPRSEAPKSFAAQMLNAEKVAGGLNAGMDGFNRWSFLNRGDLDGQWQLVRTWNPISWDYYKQVAPEPVPYYSYGILSRFTAKHSSVLDVRGGGDRIIATALRSPKGNLTVVVLNPCDQAKSFRLSLDGLRETRTLHTYRVTETTVQNPDYRMEPQQAVELSPAKADLSEELPAKSITAYSTYKLAHTEPGITADCP